MKKIGLLLINLGTPKSPRPWDVLRYLNEFLMDGRVMDLPSWSRRLLVQGVIVPFRFLSSSKAYKKLWTSQGSPLLLYGHQVKERLASRLGTSWIVELAMRYQEPSVAKGIRSILDKGVTDLMIFPLFPHYASATTGSVYQAVMEVLKEERNIPALHWIHGFATHPAFLQAWKEIAEPYLTRSYDGIIFSYHGLPQRQLFRTTPKANCLQKNCCDQLSEKNQGCYVAQCSATTRELTRLLRLPTDQVIQTFQSRLGKEPWTQPYTQETVERLAREGAKELLVFSPSFVCDCLETTIEIGKDLQESFHGKGGRKLHLVPGLNVHAKWIQALEEIVLEKLSFS